jgi:hypothetical protein
MSAVRTARRPRSRRRRLTAAAVAGAAALGAYAEAAPAAEGPQGIRAGRNITVFHNIDMVGAFGHPIGVQTQVDVFRGGHRIASTRGATVDAADDGGALEVNHGPAGAPLPGDCWDVATPDVRPGDRVVVSNPGGPAGVDEAIVDDIRLVSNRTVTVDAAGQEVPAGTPGAHQEVWVEGTAFFMNPDGTTGAPIALAALDSAGFIGPDDNQLRGAPNVIDAPLGAGTFRARYFTPFNLERNRNNRDTAYIFNALAGDAHEMGYGHVAPLPPVSMLVEGLGEQPGAALGCEAAPKAASSVGTVSPGALTSANAGPAAADPVLTVGGWAAEAVTEAEVVLSRGAASVSRPVTLTAGPGQKGWSAEFTKADLATVGRGALTVQLSVGGTLVGGTKTIAHDTSAPAGPGTPGTPAGPGTPAPAAPAAPAGAAGAGSAPAAAAQPAALVPGLGVAGARATALTARMLGGPRTVSAGSARRNGLVARFSAPQGATTALVRVYRKRGRSLTLLDSRTVRVRAGTNRVALRSRALRARLRPGTYVVRVSLRGAGSSGPAASATVRVLP